MTANLQMFSPMETTIHTYLNQDKKESKFFVIKPLEPQENNELKKLVLSVLETFGYNRPGFASQDSSLDDMYTAYTTSSSGYFIAKDGDKLLGGAGFAPLKGGDKKVCELQKMYTDPNARGLGVGKYLMERCLKEAKKKGYESCYLETTEKMIQAQHLYKKSGFEESKKLGDTGHFGCGVFMLKSRL